jgi:zinc protease
LFGISATIDGQLFAPARDAILAEIELMQNELVAPTELNKAVKQFVAATLSARKTMQGQAQDLGGCWLAAADLNFSQRYLAAVQRVSAADLQRVAREYLTAENRTLYALLPSGASPKSQSLVESLQEWPIQKLDLPNGLRLLLKEDHRLPFVEFRMVFKGGVLAETSANNGLTQVASRMLLKGTGRRTAEQIAREIESVGGNIDSYGGNNSFGINAEVLSSDFNVGLDLLADVLLQSAFPAAEFEREREIQLAAIKAQRDQMLPSAGRAMRREMFGETSYGLDALGSEASVEALTIEELQRFHTTLCRPANAVLAIYGDVNAAETKAAVEKAFATWQSGAAPTLSVSKQSLAGIKRVTETRDKKQAVLVLGFGGASLQDRDRYALELIQEACSDLGSRLFMRIRDQLGLAYYVGAQNFVGIAPGYFAFYVGTTPEKADLVEKELLLEADLLRREGLSPEELKRAKAKIIGQKKISRQDLGTLAMTTALDELYGLGYAHADLENALFEQVTHEQVLAAAQKYLRADACVIAWVKPPD